MSQVKLQFYSPRPSRALPADGRRWWTRRGGCTGNVGTLMLSFVRCGRSPLFGRRGLLRPGLWLCSSSHEPIICLQVLEHPTDCQLVKVTLVKRSVKREVLQVQCLAVLVCLVDARLQVGQPEPKPELKPELQPQLQPHSVEAWLNLGFECLFTSLSFSG